MGGARAAVCRTVDQQRRRWLLYADLGYGTTAWPAALLALLNLRYAAQLTIAAVVAAIWLSVTVALNRATPFSPPDQPAAETDTRLRNCPSAGPSGPTDGRGRVRSVSLQLVGGLATNRVG